MTPSVNSDATILFPAPKLVLQHILMTCLPYFFTEQQAINTSPSCVCEEHHDPNCTTSMVPVSPSRRSPRHHPLPPLDANTHAADAVPLPATNSSGGLSSAHRFVDLLSMLRCFHTPSSKRRAIVVILIVINIFFLVLTTPTRRTLC